MKNINFKIYLSIIYLFLVLISCKKSKDETLSKDIINERLTVQGNKIELEEFAKILSKAISKESVLREFIKNKAIEQIDFDYDVFYNFIKDDILYDGKSVRQILINYSENEDKFIQLEKQLPLVTIFIPTLPSGFSATSWNDKTEIPVVFAYNNNNPEKLNFFKDGNISMVLNTNEIPGFPTLVVKNNERISLKVNNVASYSKRSYTFVNQAFDNQLSEKSMGGKNSFKKALKIM